jgi:hypothetical protein
MKRRRITIVVVGGVLAVVALGMLAAFSPDLYEVEDKGRHLLPWPSGKVYKVEVLGQVTIYADEESRPHVDFVSGLMLISAGVASLVLGLVLRALDGASRPQLVRFYLFTFAGAGFLGLDEMFGIHETIGANLRFLAGLGGVDKADDVIFGAYALPAFAYVVAFRNILVSQRRALILFGVALVLFLVSAATDVDVFEVGFGVEDAIEVLSTVCLVAGLGSLAVRHVSAAIETRPPERRPAAVGSEIV